MVNPHHFQPEAVIWQPTERTERGKASMFLSHIGIVDDRLNPQKVQFSFNKCGAAQPVR